MNGERKHQIQTFLVKSFGGFSRGRRANPRRWDSLYTERKIMKPEHVEISQGNPLYQEADVLIHPTTGTGAPDGERFPDFFQKAGNSVLHSLQQKQPLRIGEATTTEAGNLPFQSIVHVPVSTGPDTPTTPDNIQVAYRTALVMADESPHQTLVMPAAVSADILDNQLEEVATTLWKDLEQYPPASLRTIRIVDPDSEWIDLFQKQKKFD